MTEIGKVDTKKQKRVYEDTHAEWRITQFFSLTEYNDGKHYDSPTFSIEGTPLFFSLFPSNIFHPEYAALYLNSKVNREFSIEYNFGFRKLDGSVEQLKNGSGIMKGTEARCAQSSDIVLEDVLRRKSELMPNDVLTFTCTIKRDIIHSTEANELEKPKALKFIRLDTLSENLKDLFGDQETSDVILKVKDKEYKAHRSILIARSSVFAATFKHDTLEKQTGMITISDCDPDSFQQFLYYLYSGKLGELSCCSALNLYYMSDKYNVQELKAYCVECLIECLTVENICEIAVFASKYDDMQLLPAIQDFFNKNVCKILETTEWEHLMEKDFRLANKLLKEMSKVKLKH